MMEPRRDLTCRLFLTFVGLLYLGLAIWCTLDPTTTANVVGFHLVGGSGVSEFITVYGGLEFGMAMIFLAPWVYPGFLRAALASCALLHGSLVAFRTFSFGWSGSIESQTYKLAAGEWVILLLSVAFLVRFAAGRNNRRPAASPPPGSQAR